MDFENVSYGMVVPQRVYTAPSTVTSQREPIYFHQDRHEGVYLHDALFQRVAGLDDRDSRPETTTTSSRITLRINVSAERVFLLPQLITFLSSIVVWVPRFFLSRQCQRTLADC